ncbi:MAG TPA: histidinol dehydrogenase [Longimicrobiales bacterium]|nr:histidinol dehydrogenase [Longimicrobiales bacterium]
MSPELRSEGGAPGRIAAATAGAPAIALVSALDALPRDAERILFQRGSADEPDVASAVAAILGDVRARGDAALIELAQRFDGVTLTSLEVPRAEWEQALRALDPDVRAALEQAARAIEAFHRAQLPRDIEIEGRPGLRLGRRAEPLERIGVYAPGGRAAYPSSVLMGVVPARVAGVGDIVVCSPPGRDGLPPAVVLAAAAIGGADRVFAIGGAGAIAALAYGTASVPAVDRIVGPGNAWVNEAKLQVTRVVGIDNPAGPSELLVLADDSADADLVAVELLAQAEHDPDASCVLVTTSGGLLGRVRERLAERVPREPRREIIEQSLASNGALLLAEDVDGAIAFANRYAPEHLLVLTREPRSLLSRLRNAGTIFLGPSSSVAFGDYMTGANHVLPTGGLARLHSGLSVQDFLRFSTWQELDAPAAAALATPTGVLADAEGLPAHAAAARLRSDGDAGTRAELGPDRPVLRAEYRALTTYDPGREPCAIDLSDNTNLWGPNPAAARAVRTAADAALTRYPPVYVPALKRRIAALLGVAPDNVATGCGSDDVIDSALRAFCAPGDLVAYAEPTFGMIPAFARMNALNAAAVPLAPELALDVNALLAARAAVTYVCRPNNPTGTLFERGALDRLERQAAGVLLVDEAYIDFAGEAGLAGAATASSRTIVLRTFSKAWGLAGLRLGFAVGPADLIAEIEKSRGPYKVNALAEQAAFAVLDEGREWVEARVRDVVLNRDRLTDALTALGLRVLPSAANFVLAVLPEGEDANDWNARLRAAGVAVRPFPALRSLGECVRITVGPPEMMEPAVDAISTILRQRETVNG